MTVIFHICKTYIPDSYGGVETYIHNIFNNSTKFKHIILTAGSKKTHKKENIYYFKTSKKIRSDNISIDLIKFLYKNRKTISNIHFHSPWPSVEFFLIFFKFKIVVTYHSDIVHQKILYFFFKPFQRAFLKKSKCIIVTSKNYLESSTVLQKIKEKIKIVPIGLKYEKPYKVKNDNESELFKKYIIYIGNNRKYKGLELLKKLIEEKKYNFVLVGNNLEFLKGKNVKIYTNVSEHYKMYLISKSYFLILTSNLRSEAYGIVLLEAMMQGKPLLTSNINTGVSFINSNKINGLQFENNNYKDLLLKTETLYNFKIDKYKEYTKNNKKKYNKYFKLETMIESLDKIYLEFFK